MKVAPSASIVSATLTGSHLETEMRRAPYCIAMRMPHANPPPQVIGIAHTTVSSPLNPMRSPTDADAVGEVLVGVEDPFHRNRSRSVEDDSPVPGVCKSVLWDRSRLDRRCAYKGNEVRYRSHRCRLTQIRTGMYSCVVDSVERTGMDYESRLDQPRNLGRARAPGTGRLAGCACLPPTRRPSAGRPCRRRLGAG